MFLHRPEPADRWFLMFNQTNEENKVRKQQSYLVHSINSMLYYLGFLQWLIIISSVSYSLDESEDCDCETLMK